MRAGASFDPTRHGAPARVGDPWAVGRRTRVREGAPFAFNGRTQGIANCARGRTPTGTRPSLTPLLLARRVRGRRASAALSQARGSRATVRCRSRVKLRMSALVERRSRSASRLSIARAAEIFASVTREPACTTAAAPRDGAAPPPIPERRRHRSWHRRLERHRTRVDRRRFTKGASCAHGANQPGCRSSGADPLR
jgi:hypothetical protein